MLLAILAGIAALAVVLAIVYALYRRSKKKTEDTVPHTKDLKQVDTYGVEPLKQKTSFGTTGTTEVPQHTTSSGTAGEMLNSRFVAMGVLAAAIFGTLSAKLWSMQILQASDYRKQAEANLYTTVYTPAPRGIIYDANGVPLVTNRSSYTVIADSSVADDRDVCLRLSTILGIPYQVVRQNIQDSSTGAQNNRVVATDVSLRNIAFISEHADAFSGISTEMRTARAYPYGALAAHVLGYASTASSSDLQNADEGRNVLSGDVVGKSGVEYTYENLLAGDHGTRTLLTNASGVVQRIVSETNPTRGNDIYLTIKAPVQEAADKAMRSTLAPNGQLGAGNGSGAGLVCLDATNGEIIALSNFPSYAPGNFVGGISSDVWNSFNSESSHYPLMDRVVQGTYPAASTFKGFTSFAALQCGVATSSSTYYCSGTWTGFGSSYAQKCWNHSGHGTLNLVGGIAHSCDVVFYEIAKGFYDQRATLGETAMQDYVKEYGLGSKLGIDLSGEAEGRIPTPEWKAEYFKDAPEEAQWLPGDMTNMAIGQGYVLVTPLQIAAGYAGIATGTVYRPHVMKEVRNSLGETVLSYEPEVIATPTQSEANAKLVHEGLKEVMTVNNYDDRFFSGLNYTVAGKTGTAQVSGKKDYSWFVCYAPADNPKYVCACLTEEGVSSTVCSMPMCATVIQAAMSLDAGNIDLTSVEYIDGSYTTVASSSSSSTSTARED